MKRTKTFKSLAELSADSIDAVDAELEEANPTEPQVPVESPRRIPDGFPRVSDARGFRNWGINE
jgi:hypothetical protein